TNSIMRMAIVAMRISLHPKQRLTDRNVADHFRVGWIRPQRLPRLEVFRLAVRQAGEKQQRRANRPLVPVLHVTPMRPGALVLDERVQVFGDLAYRAAVGRGELPEVVLRRGEDLADRRE